jgi:hypothetical protein
MSDLLFDHAMETLRTARSRSFVPCKVCGGEAKSFDIIDFNKSCEAYPFGVSAIPVTYRICEQCHFIFTNFFDDFADNQWRTYIYNDDYAAIDPQYRIVRPRANARIISAALFGRKAGTIGLDFGGGNGMTTRLLRAKGWAFDSYDPYGVTEMLQERIGRYNFCSAIEVFEHAPDPVRSLEAIVNKASPSELMIMIGTTVHDGLVSDKSRLSWWYAAPRNGHVSLYSRKSLQLLGETFGLTYSCIGRGPHILTRGISKRQASAMMLGAKVLRRIFPALGAVRDR